MCVGKVRIHMLISEEILTLAHKPIHLNMDSALLSQSENVNITKDLLWIISFLWF